ncbi:MAG: PilZ domain-containing protein [Pseudomonadota bacterium]
MTALSRNHAILTQNPNLQKDHRLHRRVDLTLHGRFLNSVSEEHSLVTVNLSCGGARIRSNHIPNVGEQIVCYFDELGRVAGAIVRHTEDGFAIGFNAVRTKRDRLADKLTWLHNKVRLDLHEERGARRYAADGPAILIRQDGRRLQCRVIDISLTGAGFEAEGPAPMIGEQVIAGNLSGEVVRRSGNSFGVRFTGAAGVQG